MFGFGRSRAVRVVERFVGALNARDADAIAGMIDDDVRFVDSCGDALEGRDNFVMAARRFFELEGNFAIQDVRIVVSDADILLRGRATADDDRLACDTLWRARTAHDKIVHWQSYGRDSPALARILVPEAVREAEMERTAEAA